MVGREPARSSRSNTLRLRRSHELTSAAAQHWCAFSDIKVPRLTPPFFVEGQVSRLLSRHTQKSSDGCFLAGKQMHYFEPLNEDDIEQANGADAVKVRHFYFTLVAGAGHRER